MLRPYQRRYFPHQLNLLRAVTRWDCLGQAPLGHKIIDEHDTSICIDRSPTEMVSCPSVLLDPHDKDDSRRYKMVYFLRCRHNALARSTPFGKHNAGLHLSFLLEGIDWTGYEGNPVFGIWGSDVDILTFDPIDCKYILFGRYGGQSDGSGHPNFDGWFAPVWPSLARWRLGHASAHLSNREKGLPHLGRASARLRTQREGQPR